MIQILFKKVLTLQSSEQWLCGVVSVVIMVISVTMGVTLLAAVSMERQRPEVSFVKVQVTDPAMRRTQMECGA